MNARQARARRAAERAQLQADLDAMSSATPQLVGSTKGQDCYLVGRVLLVLPALLDDYPSPIKDAVDRRRRAALTGRCDCGATRHLTRRNKLVLNHEAACNASDERLGALAAQHGLALTT